MKNLYEAILARDCRFDGKFLVAVKTTGIYCRQPLPIVVPCHRVVGANSALTGFGGGLETKVELLALEARAGDSTMT
jgi:hypothetical protein